MLVNPASGGGATAKRWPALLAALQGDHGIESRAALTTACGDGSELARAYVDAGGRELVVLGGDGTIGEVVTGLLSDDGTGVRAKGVTMTVVHQGTGGDLARGLSLARGGHEALAVVSGGDVQAIDLGIAEFRGADGRPGRRAFSGSANIGMGADVVRQVERLKRLGSSASFAAAAVWQLLRNEPRPVVVEAAGHERVELSIVDAMCCNNQWMGGGMHAAPEALLDDGMLDVVLVHQAPRLRLVGKFPKIYRGTHLADPLVRVLRTPEVRVSAAEGAPQQGVVVDGEAVGTTPAHLRILPGALRVRVPAGTGRRVSSTPTT